MATVNFATTGYVDSQDQKVKNYADRIESRLTVYIDSEGVRAKLAEGDLENQIEVEADRISYIESLLPKYATKAYVDSEDNLIIENLEATELRLIKKIDSEGNAIREELHEGLETMKEYVDSQGEFIVDWAEHTFVGDVLVNDKSVVDSEGIAKIVIDETKKQDKFEAGNSLQFTPDGSILNCTIKLNYDPDSGVLNIYNTPSPEGGKVVTLVAYPTEGGTVYGAGTYKVGEIATIVAQSNSEYTFDKWSDGDTNAVRSITVTDDIALIAFFK